MILYVKASSLNMAFKHDIEKRFIESTPVKGFIHLSKRIYIPSFKNLSLYELWPAFRLQLKKTSLLERASAISFNVFMAIPPTLIFAFTLIPYLPISGQFIEQLFGIIRDVVPGQRNNSVIIEFLRDFLTQPRNELLSFGLLIALFFSSSAMMGVLRSFDKNYEGFSKRTGIQKRKTALRLTIIVYFLVFLCLSLLIAQGVVLEWLGIKNYAIRNAVVNLRWVIIVLLLFFSVAFIYRQGAPVAIKWPYITPGSLLATVLMILATILVSVYVNNFGSYNKLYGSISAIFIIMSFIYVNALVVLLGFELNVTITSLQAKAARETI